MKAISPSVTRGRRARFAATLALVVAVVSTGGRCGRSSGYSRAVASGRSTVAAVREFHSLFPQAKDGISYYANPNYSPTWTSKTGLYHRYVLEVELDIVLDGSKTRVISSGPPKFWLTEVRSVARQPGGATSVSYNGAAEKQFGPSEWSELVKHHGDFRAIGVELKTDQPVKDFDTALAAE